MNEPRLEQQRGRTDVSPRERARKTADKGTIAEDRSFVKALARGLIILETFSRAEKTWMNVAEVADRARLPKPTVMRFLRSLERMGHLQYSRSRGQYRLGAGVLALGYAAREPYSLGELVRPYLSDLANTYGVHASLAKRDRLDALEVEVSHSLKTLMTLQLEVGSRLPLAGTATGTALIAALPKAEFDYLLVKMEGRHKKNWPELLPRIEAGCREVAQKGYVTMRRGWNSDINGVAVPLVFPGGSPIFALACGAPAPHLPPEKQHVIGRRLIGVRAEIEQKLRKGDLVDGGALQ